MLIVCRVGYNPNCLLLLNEDSVDICLSSAAVYACTIDEIGRSLCAVPLVLLETVCD